MCNREGSRARAKRRRENASDCRLHPCPLHTIHAFESGDVSWLSQLAPPGEASPSSSWLKRLNLKGCISAIAANAATAGARRLVCCGRRRIRTAGAAATPSSASAGGISRHARRSVRSHAHQPKTQRLKAANNKTRTPNGMCGDSCAGGGGSDGGGGRAGESTTRPILTRPWRMVKSSPLTVISERRPIVASGRPISARSRQSLLPRVERSRRI